MDYSSLSSPTAGLGITGGAVAELPDPRDATHEVAVVDCGEPLVEVGPPLANLGCYHAAGWAGTSPTAWLRARVAERLASVAAGLPDGFGLAIFDGWRSMETVCALYEHFYGPGSTLEPGFLADPDEPGATPPHLTGGAVDVTLSWRGTPLSLGTPFDEFSDRAALRALESSTDPADALDRSLRRLLGHSMLDAGFAPYEPEWWHYSWGDAAWARWCGEGAAHYGPAAPAR